MLVVYMKSLSRNKRDKIGYLRIFFLVLPYLVIVGIFQLVGYLIAGLDVKSLNDAATTEQSTIISFFSLLGTLLVIWLFTHYVDKIKFKEVGFKNRNVLKESLIGFIVGAGAVCIGFLLLVTTKEIIPISFDFNLTKLLLIVSLFLFVAISEEILVRGYILRNLMVSFNRYVALVVSALIFALLHGLNPNVNIISLISLFFAGLLYGITYIFNYRLWFPIAVHFSWNLLQVVLGFNVSGKQFFPFMVNNLKGENYITGGDFGFEGSVYSVIIQGVIVAGLLIYYKKTNYSKSS